MYKPKSKIWLEKDGKLIFGDGKCRLLNAVKQTGSISKAAEKTGMTYKKAWSSIKTIEDRLNIKLVEKRKGGHEGGGSFLSKEGEELLIKFEKFREGLNKYVDEKFKKIFDG